MESNRTFIYLFLFYLPIIISSRGGLGELMISLKLVEPLNESGKLSVGVEDFMGRVCSLVKFFG